MDTIYTIYTHRHNNSREQAGGRTGERVGGRTGGLTKYPRTTQWQHNDNEISLLGDFTLKDMPVGDLSCILSKIFSQMLGVSFHILKFFLIRCQASVIGMIIVWYFCIHSFTLSIGKYPNARETFAMVRMVSCFFVSQYRLITNVYANTIPLTLKHVQHFFTGNIQHLASKFRVNKFTIHDWQWLETFSKRKTNLLHYIYHLCWL